MKIILVTWGSTEKTAYPFEEDTLTKIISNFNEIANIEIIEFLGSIYQPQDKIRKLPFNYNENSTPSIINWMENLIEERLEQLEEEGGE